MDTPAVRTDERIVDFLRLIWKPGEVREFRALKHDRYKHTASGYFDSPEKLAAVVATWDGRTNVFLTLNPVNPALLARASNRIEPEAEHTTADMDIRRRHWLFLDVDAVRPSGISSTDEERQGALEVLRRATAWLTSQDWPAPITAMSGNGYYGLYAIDVPNDPASALLIKGVLDSLAARFNTEQAHIDTTVYNASRIIGIVGTRKVKGDTTEDRPHRRSELLDTPEAITLVRTEQLASLQPEKVKPSAPPRQVHHPGLPRPLTDLLAEKSIDYRPQPPDANGVTWYHLRRCPFHDDGQDFECGVGQHLPDGAYAGHGFHPECSGKGWQDWKRALGLDSSQATAASLPTPVLTPQPLASSYQRDLSGATFILDAPAEVQALWGDGEEVLWSRGEPAMIYGPTGVGKGTLVQQIVLASIGVRPAELLGFSVQAQSRWLYFALDRPTQIVRSFRRMVSEADREVLDQRLKFWKGPLPFDLAAEPTALLEFAQERGATAVVIDSLYNGATELSKDNVGQGVNQAFQYLTAAGIDVLVMHHPRKATVGNMRPKALADVYGSTWLTAGCGSVMLLWGSAGDLVIEFEHLKQPANQVGPFKLQHDHEAGITSRVDEVDAYSILRASNGVTAASLAAQLYGNAQPDRNLVAKATRQLDSLVKKGFAIKRDGDRGGGPGSRNPTVWYAITKAESNHETNHAGVSGESNQEALTPITPSSRSDSKTNHASNHGNHDTVNHVCPPHLVEGATCDSASEGNDEVHAEQHEWEEAVV